MTISCNFCKPFIHHKPRPKPHPKPRPKPANHGHNHSHVNHRHNNHSHGNHSHVKNNRRHHHHHHHHHHHNNSHGNYGGRYGYSISQPTPIYLYTPYNLPSTYNFGGSTGLGNPSSSFSSLLTNLLGQLGGGTSFSSGGSFSGSFGGSSAGSFGGSSIANLGPAFGSYGKH